MNFQVSGMVLACALAVGAAPAMAATGPCKVGEPAVIRISKISAKGSMAGFKKAAEDHMKWYASHGYTKDRQLVAPVMVMQGNMPVESPDQVMTLHTHSTPVPMDKRDAGWNAYVAEYRANSDIISETMVCLPAEK